MYHVPTSCRHLAILPKILRNKMVEYVKNERIILDRLDYEGIIKLSFTFQDSDSLCECDTEQACWPDCLPHPGGRGGCKLPVRLLGSVVCKHSTCLTVRSPPCLIVCCSTDTDFGLEYCGGGDLYEQINKVRTPSIL